MPVMDIRPMKKLSNEQILNAIRKDASPDYQRRIPEATKATVQDTLKKLREYQPGWNEFSEQLINRIGLMLIKNNTWSNDLAKFKRGMLQYGESIEEVNVGLIKSRTYNSDRLNLERDIFGQYPPDVQTSFHKINRQEWYPVSVNEPLLQRAFLEEGGLQNFVSAVMTAPTTSDNWDEFLLTCSLFGEYYRNGGFFKVQVDDVTDLDSSAPEARGLLRRIRAMSSKLTFMNTVYNASGMPIAVNPDDLELFITPEALAAVDVEALSAAFNIDKANVQARINVIPAENFNIPGVQAILTTRDFFVIADTRLETASSWNPVSLMTNYFLHHWQIISASRFVPAILFTTEEGTPLVIEETPVTGVTTLTIANRDGATVTNVERGELYQVIGSAVTTPEGGDNDALRLELSGNASNKTYITQLGVIHVSPDEPSTSITVKAYAVDTAEPQTVGEVSALVVGDRLQLWPNPSVDSDEDNDGNYEVTPAAPTFDDATDTVTIPNVKGVQYLKAGVNVNNDSTHVIAAETVFTAVARTGSELATGATASWTFTPSA